MKAIRVEIMNLLEGGTLVATPRSEVPAAHMLIYTTIQLKRKRHPDESFDKYKARACALKRHTRLLLML